MANLIVTIMAIGILAAASLAGLYYGGQAYMDAQSTAEANAIVSQATQIESAWRAWVRDNGGTLRTDSNSNWASDPATLTNFSSYLAVIPHPNIDITVQSGGNAATPGNYYLFDRSNCAASGTYALDSIALELKPTSKAAAICTKLSSLSGSNSGVPLAVSNPYCNWDLEPTAKYFCAYKDANANGQLDATEQRFLIFKVF